MVHIESGTGTSTAAVGTQPQVAGPTAHIATGLHLLGWAIFAGYMSVAAARVNGAVLGVFVFLTLTFLALTIGIWSQTPAMTRLGGWFGLITAARAWYASCAGVANSTWKRTLLPVFPLAPDKR